MRNKLLPCPFCGGEAKIEWEAWKEISETSGTYRLSANHSRDCYFEQMVGLNGKSQMFDTNKERLINAWNTRKPMERIVEQLSAEIEKADKRAINEASVNGHSLDYESFYGQRMAYIHARQIVKGGVDNAG